MRHPIVLALGALLALHCSSDPAAKRAAGCKQLADGSCVTETFRNPAVLQPNAEGVLELELAPTEIVVDGKRHCVRAYNGLYPAPTIDTPRQVGNEPRQIRVNLRNRFTKSAMRTTSGDGTCTCTDGNGSSCMPSGHGAHSACTCETDEGKRCHLFDFNVTNLHAHGSHVRPDYATGGGCVEKDGLRCRACQGSDSGGARECYFADDVISRVEAGGGVQHRWDIDEDHPSYEGLNWYHPHIHGSTAIQVASGATGAWVVRGPVDDVPGIAKATERIFVIMTPPLTFPPLEDGQACDEDHITFDAFHVLGGTSDKQTNLINGIRQPRIVMPPGQIERWRFLHGSFLDEQYIALFRGKDANCKSLDFEAGPVPLTQISRDGITMPRPADGRDWPFAPPYLFLSPGYRIDAMLDGSQLADGDTLCMMSARFLQADTTGTTSLPVGFPTAPTLDDLLQALTNGDLIGIVNVARSAGAPSETSMPDLEAVAALAPPLTLQDGNVDGLEKCREFEAVTDPRSVDQLVALWLLFYNTDGVDACGLPDHNVNGKNFEYTDRDTYPFDRVLPLGAVEHWRLTSGFDGHPFHLHINPFLVCPLPAEGRNASGRIFEPPFAHWRDTYLVNLDRVVDVVSEYRAFTGSYVFHCHKLNHEDHGMMELVTVCDPAVEACDEKCSGGPCAWDACAPGDALCEKALKATLCALDPATCPEAALRCQPCAASARDCPPGSFCDASTPHLDGVERCVPGCEQDADCAPTDACTAGACVAAACPGPCPPPQVCRHGTCR